MAKVSKSIINGHKHSGNLRNFPAIQILCEINFLEFGLKISKSAILIVKVPLKFGFNEFLHFVRAEIA